MKEYEIDQHNASLDAGLLEADKQSEQEMYELQAEAQD
jgi:hypothetical protein